MNTSPVTRRWVRYSLIYVPQVRDGRGWSDVARVGFRWGAEQLVTTLAGDAGEYRIAHRWHRRALLAGVAARTPRTTPGVYVLDRTGAA